MRFNILHQEAYSRGQLILRALFGIFYIAIPHIFVLLFVSILSAIYRIIAFWSILFTGKHPKSMFDFQVKLLKWNYRLIARLYHLSDGYPKFGLDVEDEAITLEIEYPEKLSPIKQILKVFFGIFYVYLPHIFILYFRMIATLFLKMIAFWVVLFSGEYPESWHKFNVGTLRWGLRIGLYMGYMTDKYPPFSGKPDDELA